MNIIKLPLVAVLVLATCMPSLHAKVEQPPVVSKAEGSKPSVMSLPVVSLSNPSKPNIVFVMTDDR